MMADSQIPHPSLRSGWGSFAANGTIHAMPWSLQRFQETGQLHFVTFSCYRRQPLLHEPVRGLFETVLEEVRRRWEFSVIGYVVMPDHVHLIVGEPKKGPLAVALQMLKQSVARRARVQSGIEVNGQPFWHRRYYDFNVCSQQKLAEKLRYLHRNPVERGLVALSDHWSWSSFRHYALGEERVVQIDSDWAEPWKPVQVPK
jgi:putative transposase